MAKDHKYKWRFNISPFHSEKLVRVISSRPDASPL